MTSPNDIARTAHLLGDPARAAMVAALMGGKALTAGELATVAGISRATASAHIKKLVDGNLLDAASQGRHRYLKLANPKVAELVEKLVTLGDPRPTPKTGPRNEGLIEARICYDHMAGELGVAVFDGLLSGGHVSANEDGTLVANADSKLFELLKIDVASLMTRKRPVCRRCLDWSVRRDHLAGALGAALLSAFERENWVRRTQTHRQLVITPPGRTALREHLGYRRET